MKRKRYWFSVIPSLILSASVLGLYPLCLTPLYHDEIIKEAQQHAVNISNYFIKRYVTGKICLLDTKCFEGKDIMISQDAAMFNIWKLRFFDAGGRIVYSTIKDEVNTVNTASYFKNKIAMGHTLSKIEKKGGKSFTGDDNVPLDVVETYIPIIRNKEFLGAFEIYLVVTDQIKRLYNIFWKSYMLIAAIIVPLMCLVIYFSKKMERADVEMQKAHKELERLSNVDGLTQLYNRRYFDRELLKEIKRLQRQSEELSLLMCDIDHFKKYNDTYGHVAGDRCIQAVAELIRSNCRRSSDVPARYGGEEFGVILPHAGPDQALKIAQSIRTSLAKEMIPHESSPVSSLVTISIGIVSLVPDHKTTAAMIISLADGALYQSKSKGRDTISLEDARPSA